MVEGEVERGKGNEEVLFFTEEDTTVAYCLSCRRVIFVGQESFISRKVMESQMYHHIAAYRQPHEIDIIHHEKSNPNRQTNHQTNNSPIFFLPYVSGKPG